MPDSRPRMRTILLIEDDAENRRLTSSLLDSRDWKVLEAEDGQAGIELALKHRPDVILCDLLMPRSNGFQVCRAIRQQLQPTKIIMISGRDYEADRASAREAGADEYLLKPITWALLQSAIERVLPADRQPIAPGNDSREVSSSPASLKFWGVRGSIPVPGPTTVGYGGNTSCVEVRADGEIIILDSGSGIRSLGISLEREFGQQPIRLTILITHTHWDHIQGFPFFLPAYNEKNVIRVLGYEGALAGLSSILAGQMETPFFPVHLHDLSSNIAIEEIKEMEFNIRKVRVCAKFVNHPGICVGYRLYTSSGSIAYLPDNEPYELLKLHSRAHISAEEARAFATAERAKLVEFLDGCEVVVLDTQFTDEEYPQHLGWGHGSLSTVVSLALAARAQRLFLFHHDPEHDDRMIDDMVARARAQVATSGKSLLVEAAREGAEIRLGAAKAAS